MYKQFKRVAIAATLLASANAHSMESLATLFSSTLPACVQETSILSMRQKITQLIYNQSEKQALDDAILTPQLEAFIKRFKESLQHHVEKGTPLKHMALFGNYGHGKTFIAKRLAQIACTYGFEYIYLSAYHFLKFEPKEALDQLEELSCFAQQYPKKIMIIIDDAEDWKFHPQIYPSLFVPRPLGFPHSYDKNNFFVLALKCNPNNLWFNAEDTCFLGLPTLMQLLGAITAHVKKELIDCTDPKITIEQDALNKDALTKLANVAYENDFTFLDVTRLIRDFQLEALTSLNRTLTRDIISREVKKHIEKMDRPYEVHKSKLV